MYDTTQLHLLSDPVEAYKSYGFAILRLYDESQSRKLNQYAIDWIYSLLTQWTGPDHRALPLDSYHTWMDRKGVDHASAFRAHNRHMIPESDISEVLLNDSVDAFISDIGAAPYEVWDEGLGWLAFRFIRPGRQDGYPFSRKEWGVAKTAVSCWIPILGHKSSETIRMIPGSHLKEYERYLPEDSKFTKDEYRLVDKPLDSEIFCPNLEPGEAVFFHPRLIHSEDVIESDVTRLSLEFRLNPLPSE